MAQYLSNELAGTTTGLTTAAAAGYKPAATVYSGRLKRFRATVTYAGQTTSDTIVLANIPAGFTFAYGVLTADTSSGSTTLAIGITGTTAKYKAAAAFTSTDTPTIFGKAAVVGAASELSATETIILTLAAATAPSSGTLIVDLYFSGPN
jgi:hypothetical protein